MPSQQRHEYGSQQAPTAPPRPLSHFQPQSSQPQPRAWAGPGRKRIQQLARAAEALMDKPPAGLVPFMKAIRRQGGLVLFGLPGFEADDMIASLVAGLLNPQSTHTADPRPQPALGPTSPARLDPTPRAPLGRVTVASSDRDMLQLLGHPGCSWLELRQLSRSISAQEQPPLALRMRELPGIPAALMLLHQAADGGEQRGAQATAAEKEEQEIDGEGVSARAAGSDGESRLLPARLYPDYLALVGKHEAGVPGAGVSSRSARKLLLRYGSLEGVVQAYETGALDAALRPVAGVRAPLAAPGTATVGDATMSGSSVGRVAVAAGAVGNKAPGAAGTGGSVGTANGVALGGRADGGARGATNIDRVRSGGGRGDGGGGNGDYPLAVSRALRNLAVTRAHVNPLMVPWETVWRHCQQQLEQERERQDTKQRGQDQRQVGDKERQRWRPDPQQDGWQHAARVAGAGEGAAGEAPLPGKGAGAAALPADVKWGLEPNPASERGSECDSPGRESTLGSGRELLPLASLHPQDELHLRSVGPFLRALADALARRRGVTFVRPHVDEQGHMADLLLLPVSVYPPQQGPPQQRQEEEEEQDAQVGVAALAGHVQEPAQDEHGHGDVRHVGRGTGGSLGGPSSARTSASGQSDVAEPACQAGHGAAGSSAGSAPPGDCDDAAVVLPAAVEAMATALVALAFPLQSGNPGTDVGVAATTRPAATPGQGPAGPPVRVCVLAPWDFRNDAASPAPPLPQSRGHLQNPKQVRLQAQQRVAQPAQASGGSPARAADRKGLELPDGGAELPAKPIEATAAAAAASRLRRAVDLLQQAVGTRHSLTHVPRTLQAALRNSSAWRLKRLQRAASAAAHVVAVVPFYELMDGPVDSDAGAQASEGDATGVPQATSTC